jgi:hypothetical protein
MSCKKFHKGLLGLFGFFYIVVSCLEKKCMIRDFSFSHGEEDYHMSRRTKYYVLQFEKW